jgi:hypothetical protein
VLLIWRDVDANHRHVSCSFPPILPLCRLLKLLVSTYQGRQTCLLSVQTPLALPLPLFSPSWIRKIYLTLACAACWRLASSGSGAPSTPYTSHSPHLTCSRTLFRPPSHLWPLRRYIPRILLTIPRRRSVLKGMHLPPYVSHPSS